MKKVECYQCDLCETIFDDPEIAEACEKAHHADGKLRVIDMMFDKNSSERGFPHKILTDIEDRSGSAAEYQLVRDGSVEEFVDDWYPE